MAGEDLAALGVKVDFTQSDQATGSLDNLTAAAGRTEKATDLVGNAADRLKAQLVGMGASAAEIAKALAGVEVKATTTATALAGIAPAVTTAVTATERINAITGITDDAFKKASASASVFASSLQGLAAIEASAAAGMSAMEVAAAKYSATQVAAAEAANAANLALFQSLTGISDAQLGIVASSAVEAEAVVASSATMAESLGAVGSAAVQSASAQVAAADAVIAANGAVAGAAAGTSTVIRESLVIAREASVGNFTRMAGSASILIGALGLLNAVLLPLIGIAVVTAGAFELATNQINNGVNGTHDLTQGLGLTSLQLSRVKEDTVTLKDTFKAFFQVLGDRIGGDGTLGRIVQDTWNGIASFISGTMEVIVGGVLGSIRVIEEGWKAMPEVLGGAGTTAGINFSKAFQSGVDDTKTALNKFYSDVAAQARSNRIEEIIKQAGKAEAIPKDGAADSVERTIQKLNDEAKAQGDLNNQVEGGTLTVQHAVEAQKLYGETASAVARIEKDAMLDAGQKASIIGRLIDAQTRYNNVRKEEQLLLDLDKIGDQQTIISREIELIGANTRARVIGIAAINAEYEAKRRLYNPSQTEEYIKAQVQLANIQVDLQIKTDAYNTSLTFTAQYMQEIDKQSNALASNLSSAFGNIGTAIGGLTTAITGYASAQADFAVQQEKIDKKKADGEDVTKQQILLTQQQQDTDTNYYASVLDSASQFFDKHSAGYKILQAVEAGYRAFQLASSIAGIAVKWTETTAVVAANTVQTASSATTAVANAAADVPFPFNLGAVGIVVALLAGFGILAGGGGGGASSAVAVDPAKALQASNGAGSVLGDSAAKSDSIANSITALAKDTNRNLEYSSQMVTSLKAIQSGISSLTSQLAQQLGVGGVFDTSKLGIGSSGSGAGSGIPLIGGLISSLFGSSSSSTTLLDQGINVASTTIGNAIANGVNANAYQTTQTKSSSSALFGLISSSSTNNNTINTPLSSDFTSQIQGIVGSLRSTVLDAATKLGVQGASSVIDSFSLNLGNISFKDMTGTQIQTALNQVFGKLGDQITAAVFPQLSKLQQVGEGSLTTLSRLVNEYVAVDDAAKTVGFTFDKVGVNSLAARDALVQASGGLDQFTQQAQFFVDHFLTSAQSLKPIEASVQSALSSLGIVGLTTKDQFTAVVQSLNLTTTGGQTLYAALMNIAPAFVKVADAASALNDQIRSQQIKLLQDEGNSIGALALQRQKELAALDASLRPLQLLTYAIEDFNTASSNLDTAKTNLANAQQALTTAFTAVQSDLTNAQQALATAQTAANQVTQTSIDKFNAFVTSLNAFQMSLATGPLANNNIQRQYAITSGIFNSTASAAAAGDPVALSNLQQASTDFLTASKASSSTIVQYTRDLALVKDAVTTATKSAQTQVDVATQQLYAIQAVGKDTQTVASALANLTKIQSIFNDAQLAYNSAQIGGTKNDTNSVIANAITNAQTVASAIDNLNKTQTAFSAAQLAYNAAQLTAQKAEATTIQASVDAAAKAAVADVTSQINNTVNGSPAANDNVDVAALLKNAIKQIDTTNYQSGYDADLKSLNSIATSALNLLHNAGIFAQWATQTDVPGGNLGSFSVGTNLYSDTKLSGVLSQFQDMQQQYIATFQDAQSLFAQIPGHAAGLNYVPRDNYVARLHEGERVLTKTENNNFSSNAELIAELKAMRAELKANGAATANNTKLTNTLLRKFTNDGSNLNVKVVA